MGQALIHLERGIQTIDGFRCSACGELTLWANSYHCISCFKEDHKGMEYIPTVIKINIIEEDN
jgi:hypothetical protein